MVVNKEVISWTIDKRVVEKVNLEAKEKDRSKSYIANKYLMEILKIK